MKYDRYRFSVKEGILFTLEYIMISGMFSYLFYDSIYAFLILMTGIIWFLKRKRKILLQKRKMELCKQFQEAICSVAAALSAGFSIENSFHEALHDMKRLYGERSLIVEELNILEQYLTVNRTLEGFLYDFSERTNVEDIRDFSVIFAAAKRNGGNFSQIIQRSVDIMQNKQETEREIEVLLSGKCFEQRIMSMIPCGIIFYLRCSTGSFMEVLYHNLVGVIGMSLCLIVYIAAYLLAEKISIIEV